MWKLFKAEDTRRVYQQYLCDEPFKHQFNKMAKQIADELFKCVWPFSGVGAFKG